jgi:hypothetical protein
VPLLVQELGLAAADDTPDRAWQMLKRPPQYTVKTRP